LNVAGGRLSRSKSETGAPMEAPRFDGCRVDAGAPDAVEPIPGDSSGILSL